MSTFPSARFFSILPKPEGSLKTESFLQQGNAQIAAGYVLYGVQTLLMLTFKYGVYGFTLNEHNEFILTHTPQIPAQTAEFAINASNQRHWEAPTQRYIAELLAGKEGVRGKNYNMRWVASMVAEVHRILMRGGVFLYPKRQPRPQQSRQIAPDVRSQPHEPAGYPSRWRSQQRPSRHFVHSAQRFAPARCRNTG